MNIHNICNRRTGQYSRVLPFFQMSQNQTLPVTVQHILTACSEKLQTASRFSGFQKQVYFCIYRPGEIFTAERCFRLGKCNRGGIFPP